MRDTTLKHLTDLWMISGPANAKIETSADHFDVIITTLFQEDEDSSSTEHPMCSRFSLVIPSPVVRLYDRSSDRRRVAADALLRDILEEEMVRCRSGNAYPDSVALSRLFSVSSQDLQLAM